MQNLGLNINRGAKICLRLRYPGDQNQFMPLDNVVDTMLHELCHIIHGPHDSKFHALWDQLRDEQQGLVMKGYTGEGFLSEGRRLGGAQMPPHEARQLAREAAYKRQKQPLGTGAGQRLGGAVPKPDRDIRRVIADAVERRNKTLKGCGTDRLSVTEIRNISDTATRNGFRTQAEEDEANETAIAQALWDLVQDDEKAQYGSTYVPPSAKNPAGNGGWTKMLDDTGSCGSLPDAITRETFGQAGSGRRTEKGSLGCEGGSSGSRSGGGSSKGEAHVWFCKVCTLQNPQIFLSCDACGAERPILQGIQNRLSLVEPLGEQPERPSNTPKASNSGSVIDLTDSPPRTREDKRRRTPETDQQQKASSSSSISLQQKTSSSSTASQTWQCSWCGKLMQRQWWTCASCGRMKDSSR